MHADSLREAATGLLHQLEGLDVVETLEQMRLSRIEPMSICQKQNSD
jgi:hypothetical protein